MRELGNCGIKVPDLCFGGNIFGWTIDEPTSFRILDAVLDAGVNFIDTADIYSTWAHSGVGGQSEIIIGNWLKSRGNRDKVIIATKLGKPMGEGKSGLSAKYMAQAVEDSLRRLQTDYIDLYQSHEDDPKTPVSETMDAFARLIEQGKVRAIGASNFGPERLEESLRYAREKKLPGYVTLQPHYNLVVRAEFETTLEPVTRKYGLTVLPYWALASGFLTGKYRSQQDASKSVRGRDAVKNLDPRGKKILAALDAVSARHNANPTRVALGWLIGKGTVPIASATSTEQLQDLVNAIALKLTPEDMQELDTASA